MSWAYKLEPNKGHVYVGRKWLPGEEKLLDGFYLISAILRIQRLKEMNHDLYKNPYSWDPLWWHPIIPLQITNKMCGCQSRPYPGSVDGSTQAHPLLSLSRQRAAYVLTPVLLHSFLIPRSKPGAKRASDTRTVWMQLPWKSFFKCTDERRETSDLQCLWKMSWRPSR